MKRISDDYIALTNREALEIQRALATAEEVCNQFAAELRSCGYGEKAEATMRQFKRLYGWRSRIHRVWKKVWRS